MSRKQHKNLLRIIVSAVFFAAAWLSPLEELLSLSLFLLTYALVGYDVLWSAWRNILNGQVFDEQFLMALASIGAFAVGEYPEAVAVMLFYQVGELFQDIAVGRSRRSIAALMDIRPDFARVLRGDQELVVSPDEVAIGEYVLVLPGERIPLDGVIADGVTVVNTSALTGESIPEDKGIGENVISGSINISGVIKVEVSSVFGESTVSKILNLVENSSAKKTHSERFITRFARYYTPCVVISALLLALIPPLTLGGDWMSWVNRALVFLVVSCPCALVIAVPLSFFGGIGGASKEGILIKGSDYLETLAQVKTAVFDKTGTLTKGSFFVTDIHPNKVTKAELLDLAAVAESYSSHPIAVSIVKAHGEHIDKNRISQISELSGLGVKALIDNKTVYVGNGRLMDEIGCDWHECGKVGTIVHVCVDSEYMGHVIIADELKPDAKQAITQLKAVGITKTVMLTGDVKAVGECVGHELGMDEIHTGLLPDGKVAVVEDLLKDGNAMVFVGDGINDAPVLARANVGIAMGALGSDAAIEAADVVLMNDNISKVALAIRISKKTMNIVRQNIIFILMVKAAVLLLGALGLTSMWGAVFADVGVMVIAVLNAMRASVSH